MLQVKYANRTVLNEQAIRFLVRKFFKTRRNVSISFDLRIKDYGSYTYDSKTMTHKILISPTLNQICPVTDEMYSKQYSERKLISTLLHEIRHAQQREKYGLVYFKSSEFAINENMPNAASAIYNAPREKDARRYEKRKIKKALKLYSQFCKKVKKCQQ